MSKMSDEVFSNVMHDPVVGLMRAPCSLLHTGKFCSKNNSFLRNNRNLFKKLPKISDDVFSNVMHDPVVGLMRALCSVYSTKGKFCSKNNSFLRNSRNLFKKTG